MKKTIQEWEKEKGFIITDKSIDIDKQITEEEINAIPVGLKHGVDHKSRTEFLVSNGYEVTRENLTNPELSAKQE